MGAEALSSRAVIGRYFQTLEERAMASWVGDVSMLFRSDQTSETYKWLGQVPMLRQWIGERQAKGLTTEGVTIENLVYEATLEIARREMTLDKTDQIFTRIDELAVRSIQHWNKLLSVLIAAGSAALCYDGQYFYDTDHSEGDSGTQDNDLTRAIVAKDSPTAAEMETSILTAIQAILGFKDNEAEPLNDGAKKFLVMVPVGYMMATAAAIGAPVIVDGSASRTGLIAGVMGDFQINMAVNARLSTTDAFHVWRTDGVVKPLIRQEEEPTVLQVVAEGSELEFNSDKHHYGVRATRNVGYGYWQMACLYTHTTA